MPGLLGEAAQVRVLGGGQDVISRRDTAASLLYEVAEASRAIRAAVPSAPIAMLGAEIEVAMKGSFSAGDASRLLRAARAAATELLRAAGAAKHPPGTLGDRIERFFQEGRS